MTWWQIIIVVSVCFGWTITAMFFGAVITNTVHSQRDVAEAAKWQLPR